MTQAQIEGYIAGKADRLLGRRSEYVWFSQNSFNEYTREYARSYVRAWLGLGTLYGPDSRIPKIKS